MRTRLYFPTLLLGASLVLGACAADSDDDDIFIAGPDISEPTPEPAEPPPPPPPFALDPDVAPVTDGSWYRPGPEATWQWQLQGTINTTYDVDIYDIDFEEPTILVNGLQASGKKVICYFSAGSAESWRPDFARFPSDVIGKPLHGWEGERYVDIRREEVYNLMTDRMDVAVAKGCDGVELDNVVTFDDDSGFGLTRSDQIAYNRNLANEAHRRGLAIALKNGGVMISDLASYYDLQINEECHHYEECGELALFTKQGKPILNAEYAENEREARRLAETLCQQAADAGTRTLILPLDLDDSFRISCF